MFSFNSSPLLSVFDLLSRGCLLNRANAPVAVVRVVVVQRAGRIDVADVVRIGGIRRKINNKTYPFSMRVYWCCPLAWRSLSFLLHPAVMFLTSTT